MTTDETSTHPRYVVRTPHGDTSWPFFFEEYAWILALERASAGDSPTLTKDGKLIARWATVL